MPWRRWVLAVAFVALLVGVSPAALGVGELVRQESHCVVHVVGQAADGEFMLGPVTCFTSLSEALAEATGNRSAFSSNISGQVLLRDNAVGSNQILSTLGIHFDGLNGSGSSISVTGGACSGGYWNTGATWANRISSSWNGCYRLRHYDNPDTSGTFGDTTGAGATHNVPAGINNKAESVAYLGS